MERGREGGRAGREVLDAQQRAKLAREPTLRLQLQALPPPFLRNAERVSSESPLHLSSPQRLTEWLEACLALPSRESLPPFDLRKERSPPGGQQMW